MYVAYVFYLFIVKQLDAWANVLISSCAHFEIIQRDFATKQIFGVEENRPRRFTSILSKSLL